MGTSSSWGRRAALLGSSVVTLLASVGILVGGSVDGAGAAPAATTTAPATVAILVAGFGSSLPASTYDPLTEGSPALTAIEAAFDPTTEPTTCNAVPDLTDTLTGDGALILPFSYNGATLTGTSESPSLTVAAYGGTASGNSPSQTVPSTVTPYLATEVAQVHTVWPSAKVLIVGHSEGGFVAESYFASALFSPTQEPWVTGVFSLDSPINGVADKDEAAALLKAIHVPASSTLLDLFQADWDNAYKDGATNDAAVFAKENGTALYVPVGTLGDNVYRLPDSPFNPLVSQVLVDSTGQPVFGAGSPNFLDPATPPRAGITDPAGILASHQCVMDNATVIGQIAARVTNPSIPLLPPTSPTSPTTPASPTAGYREVAADGGIFSFGSAQFYGSMAGKPLDAPIVGLAAAPTGAGYWEVAADGGVFAFGSAQFYGSIGGKPLDAPIVGMTASPNGQGYWEVAADGGIFAFGNATFDGSMGGKPLNRPVTGMATAT